MGRDNRVYPGKQLTLKHLVALWAFIIALCSAWLYVAGWTYAYHYFDRFHIPLLMVDLPREHYFVYGTVVLRHHALWILAMLAAILSMIVLWNWLPLVIRGNGVVIFAAITLALFWIGQASGVRAAHFQFLRQKSMDYPAYPRVKVWRAAKPEGNNRTAQWSGDLCGGCYRLLLHSQDRLFLFRSFKGAPAAEVATAILPWSEIASLLVLPDNTSCP